MKVKVAEFRRSVDFAFDAINIHWCACVGEHEKILWFTSAFRRFSELSELECSRAKPEDRYQLERALDLFAAHCEQYEDLWLKARAYRALCQSGVGHAEAFAQLKQRLPMEIIHAHQRSLH